MALFTHVYSVIFEEFDGSAASFSNINGWAKHDTFHMKFYNSIFFIVNDVSYMKRKPICRILAPPNNNKGNRFRHN